MPKPARISRLLAPAPANVPGPVPPPADVPAPAPAAASGSPALRAAEWTVAGLERQLALQLPGEDAAAVRAALQQARAVSGRHRLRVPHHYLALIQAPGDPLWLQAVPTPAELEEPELPVDPLAEDDPRHAPTPHLTHRYPDRALLLVTDLCPLFCRFCMRKRKTLTGGAVTGESVRRGIAAVRERPAIREVILSGGDPLMLPDARLAAILGELREIPHVRVLRVHTRMPCVQPQRVTPELARLLAGFKPLHVAVHFNHPREVTPEARAALALLSGAGLPLHNQAVLLRGVNDDAAVLAELFRALVRCRVHPYYLHHADLVPGTAPFRTSVQRGLAIVRELRRIAPELAMLHYVLDTPGGGGKVPLEGGVAPAPAGA